MSPGRPVCLTGPVDITTLLDSDNPYPALAQLRASGPLQLSTRGYWLASGYEVALEALRHPVMGTGPIAASYVRALPPGAARDEMSHRINFLDPPDHPRVRGLVSKAFTPKRIAMLQPWIAETSARLLDALPGTEPVDLLEAFSHQVPSLVISELLGIPAEDRDRLTMWSDAVAPLLSVGMQDHQRRAAIDAAEEFHAYLRALIIERRQSIGTDLLSALIIAEEQGERLSEPELMSLVATLYSAGHRTTRDLFTNGLSVLMREPGGIQAVADGRWSAADVVGEFLRFETPTHYVSRFAMDDLVLGGTELAAGARILVLLGAANHDPAAFDEPDVFAPVSRSSAPLSFAFGAHYCLGASLARSEAEIMLRALTDRWPGVRPAEGASLHWHQRGPFRGLDRLVVELS